MAHPFNSFKDLLVEVAHRTGASDTVLRSNIYASFAQQELNRRCRTLIQRIEAPLLKTYEFTPGESDISGYASTVFGYIPDPRQSMVSTLAQSVKKFPHIYRIREIMYVRDPEADQGSDRIIKVSPEQFDRKLADSDRDKYYKVNWRYTGPVVHDGDIRGPQSSVIITPTDLENLEDGGNPWRVLYYSDFPDITSPKFYLADPGGVPEESTTFNTSMSPVEEYGELVMHSILKQVYVAQTKIEEAAAISTYLDILIGAANMDDEEMSPLSTSVKFSEYAP